MIYSRRATSFLHEQYVHIGAGLAFLLVAYLTFISVGMYVKERVAPDFPSYYFAAAVASTGQSPYDYANLTEIAAGKSEVFPFLYAPPVLWLLSPLARLPLRDAQLLFQLLNVACVLPLLYFTYRLIVCLNSYSTVPRMGSSHAGLATIGATALVLPAIVWSIQLGQINIVLALLMTVALYASERGKNELCGIYLSLAIVGKLFPVALVGFLAVRHRWRGITMIAVCLFALVSVGSFIEPWVWQDYANQLRDAGYGKALGGIVDPNVSFNIGFAGAFARSFGERTLPASLGPQVLFALMILALPLLYWKCRKFPLYGCWLVLVLFPFLFCPPFVWCHYLIFFLPAIGLVFLDVLRSCSPAFSGWLFAINSSAVWLASRNNGGLAKLLSSKVPLTPEVVSSNLNLLAAFVLVLTSLTLLLRSCLGKGSGDGSRIKPPMAEAGAL